MGTSLLLFLAMSQILHITATVLFHEQSSVVLRPTHISNDSDFGFTMRYRTVANTLVVGEPSVDYLGKVHSCELENTDTFTEVECIENFIDIESLTEFSRKKFPDQKFYNGASIAVTAEYIFTCAPMLTADLALQTRHISDAFGTCYMQNLTDTYQYVGTFEKFLKRPLLYTNFKSFIGGTGWSTLIDEEHDLLIIVKTTLNGDFLYTSAKNPVQKTKSMVMLDRSKKIPKIFERFTNLGHGITAGKFFTNEETVYAFSVLTIDTGAILFLKYTKWRELNIINDRSNAPFMLRSKAVGTMFGSTLSAADLNLDGRDELLVGAPTQSEDECLDCGALHIYLGGDMYKLNDRDRLVTILGNKNFGRFGSAIASDDIDGDGIPEIAVSAPYEDDGTGAVYVLSGYDINALLKIQGYMILQVSDLKMTQRIQKKNFKTLGFSLQFVADVDDNGCNELAAGSPGSGKVLLYKSFGQINVTLSTELIGEQIVREQDKQFDVKVCAKVQMHRLPYDMVGNLNITNSIIGEATSIRNPQFVLDISCYNCSRVKYYCKNVTVILNDTEPRYYKFTSKAEFFNTAKIFNSTGFNNTWVVTSPYSKLENSFDISRHCKGDDCIPKLSLGATWTGSHEYVLGSTANETVKINVRNEGNATYEACVLVRASGSPVAIDCASETAGFRCDLYKPLKRNSEQTIDVVLNFTMPTNLAKELLVEVLLHENCNQRNLVTNRTQIRIPYTFTTDDIHINGTSHHRNVTDKQILDRDVIVDDQDYLITNNGLITWQNIYAIITINKKPYIHSFKAIAIGSGICIGNDKIDTIAYNCTFTIHPNSTQRITAVTELLSNEIKNNLFEEKLNYTSELKLFLLPTEVVKPANATTVRYYQIELSIWNNKLLIALLAVLIAIIILGILIFVLYKCAFFRRKQKERLLVHKESIRRQSTRRATLASEEGPDGLQIDVVDDSPFDTQNPETTNDGVVLVESQAQVH